MLVIIIFFVVVYMLATGKRYSGYENCRSVWTTDSEWVTVCDPGVGPQGER